VALIYGESTLPSALPLSTLLVALPVSEKGGGNYPDLITSVTFNLKRTLLHRQWASWGLIAIMPRTGNKSKSILSHHQFIFPRHCHHTNQKITK